MSICPAILPFVCLSALAAQQPAAEIPVEFGRVAWGRDFAAAEQLAKANHLPLLVLFSEVPG